MQGMPVLIFIKEGACSDRLSKPEKLPLLPDGRAFPDVAIQRLFRLAFDPLSKNIGGMDRILPSGIRGFKSSNDRKPLERSFANRCPDSIFQRLQLYSLDMTGNGG